MKFKREQEVFKTMPEICYLTLKISRIFFLK